MEKKKTQKKKNVYLTTTLPYVNADPHIGFAFEIIRADAVARFYRSKGYEVFFNTGTDEHGLKIYRKAEEAGKTPQEYVDIYAARFGKLRDALDVSYTNFIRTTDEHHVRAAAEFWRRCKKNGDIEKRMYKVKYCVGCELEKTDSELENGRCPLHPTQDIEIIEEENYFFKFSNYGQKLLELYDAHPDLVLPEGRMNEVRKFVEGGLEDFSVSRLKSKMPWGVPVPDDEDHVMYVWFDALVNYISALGWPDDKKKFKEFWPVIQFAGKDNLRQQAAMWQAMLFSAGLEPSKQIIIHGFITSRGQKISKSLGNTVDPFEYVERYGTDAVRYYLLGALSPFEDSDFTEERFREIYNADLANGLGNLVSRTIKMAEQYFGGVVKGEHKHKALFEFEENGRTLIKDIFWFEANTRAAVDELLPNYRFDKAVQAVWSLVATLDRYISEYEPYKLVKKDPETTEGVIWNVLYGIHTIGELIEPFMPATARAIHEHVVLRQNEDEKVFAVTPLEKPLFPRIQ